MAPVLFAKAGIENQPIKVFNNGEQSRDFTYVDDIIQGIALVAEDKSILKNYQILNIGKGSPVALMDFFHLLEKELRVEFKCDFMPPQKGDVVTTYSDTTEIEKLGYKASTPLEIGIPKFVAWFLKYYNYHEKN
jgi:UDP-glucuronate 4-epimerase